MCAPLMLGVPMVEHGEEGEDDDLRMALCVASGSRETHGNMFMQVIPVFRYWNHTVDCYE